MGLIEKEESFECVECGTVTKFKFNKIRAKLPHKAEPLECPKCGSIEFVKKEKA